MVHSSAGKLMKLMNWSNVPVSALLIPKYGFGKTLISSSLALAISLEDSGVKPADEKVILSPGLTG